MKDERSETVVRKGWGMVGGALKMGWAPERGRVLFLRSLRLRCEIRFDQIRLGQDSVTPFVNSRTCFLLVYQSIV